MRWYLHFFVSLLVILISFGFARMAFSSAEGPAPVDVNASADVNAASGYGGLRPDEEVLSFPYIAEIIGDNVYIRSGPGTNYYTCGKLNRGDRVKVVSTQHSWSRIVPPEGSFSWISTQYVSIDPNNAAIGIVTGDSVRVYAGSETIKPLYSTTLQLKLSHGDKVTLLGEEKDDYYKISPPADAYLWVSTEYTKPVGPVGETALIVKEGKEPNDTTMVTAVKPYLESEKLKEYYALEKQIQAEKTKPEKQQNYTDIKKALIEIANNKAAGKAARYAAFTIKQVERFELALAVAKEAELQNAQLEQIKEKIDKARATRLSEYQELGRFAAVGQLQSFETYGPGHYRIVDESGKTICYAKPSEAAAQMDFSKFIGEKVGLVGTTEPHPDTQGALVRFTEVVPIK